MITGRFSKGGMRAGLRRPARAALRLSVALMLTACGGVGGDVDSLEPERVDSAGIEIVLNRADGAVVPVFATLGDSASLRVGAVEGRPEEVFGVITDVLPLSDGSVAVLDGQAAEVRVFDSTGTYRASFGAKGRGPGELDRPSVMALLPGDTLAVYDPRPMRITRFGPDGALGRITTLQDTRSRVTTAAFLPDGRLLGQSRWLSPEQGRLPGPEPSLVRDTVVLTVFTTLGAVADTIDVVPGRETVTSIEQSGQSISVFRRTAAFGRTNVFAVHSDGIWSSANDRFDLRLYDAASARLLRIVRAPGLERPTTDALAETVRSRAFEEAETPAVRSQTETWYALSPRPATLPAYERLVVDDRGRLWASAWSTPGSVPRWWVFDRSGVLLGSVDVPSGATIMAVRCGAVWGVEQDALDVSYVVRFALSGEEGC